MFLLFSHRNCPEPKTTARLLDKLVGHFLEGHFHTHAHAPPLVILSALSRFLSIPSDVHKTHVLYELAVVRSNDRQIDSTILL
jgi:hypothetical protein